MLRWALIFFVIAVVLALFGFLGPASMAATAAKWLFIAFLVIAVLSLVLGGTRRPTI